MPLKSRARAAAGKLKRRLRRLVAAPATKPARKPATKPPQPRRSPASRKNVPSRYTALEGDRLVHRPVFVLSSIRSGSTLLRVMLNSHSQIHAPHELHLGGLGVHLGGRFVKDAMAEVGLDPVQLQFLLWDRVLHRELTRHGKTVLVNKTPSDAFRWRRILECWPDARFIFLLRHPASVADSWHRAHPRLSTERVANTVLRYMLAVERARAGHEGLTVRYEDITIDPEAEMKRICDFLEVDYEQSMVDYGSVTHGGMKRGLGDWSDRIQSGKVHPIERLPLPDEIPTGLIDISKQWGYLHQDG